jgi:RNA polymerase sigma factor (sigma-70 family)
MMFFIVGGAANMEDKKVEELIAKYGDLAKKLAWKYWKKLPPATKMWVDPEDLISEAYLCFVKTVRDKYDASKASECTFIFWVVNNMLINFCLKHQQGKRRGVTLSLDEALEATEEGEVAQFNPKYLGVQDNKFKKLEAYDALMQVYTESSEECRQEIRRWFGQNHRERPRRSVKGKEVNKEFRYRASMNRLSPYDCVELMREGVCLP